MIIGFLGKGGSGKSTLSYRFIRFLESQDKKVLAIDADHNMDLSYNLGMIGAFPYLGQALSDIKTYVGLEQEDHYSKAFDLTPTPSFSLALPDIFTKAFSHPISPNVRLMAAGPHTEEVLYDKSCSHSLITPLKIFLPHLDLKENEFVVVDETAGLDSVGTGITTGFDVAVVAFEPTIHSIKVARQIASMLHFYETPYVFVANKMNSLQDLDFVNKELGQAPHVIVPHESAYARPDQVSKTDKHFTTLLNELLAHKTHQSRLERTLSKYKRNSEHKAMQT